MQEPQNTEVAINGIAILNTQLSACTAFLSAAIGQMDHAKMPTTVRTYRHVLSHLVGISTAMGNLSLALGGTGSTPDVPVVVVNVDDVKGFVEHAVVKLSMLFQPFALDRLPDGVPGTEAFEKVYKQNTTLSRGYGIAADLLHKLGVLLKTDTHALGLPEDVRERNWRDSLKQNLVAQIEAHGAAIKEAEDFIAEERKTLERLHRELADVDQTTLFSDSSSSQS